MQLSVSASPNTAQHPMKAAAAESHTNPQQPQQQQQHPSNPNPGTGAGAGGAAKAITKPPSITGNNHTKSLTEVKDKTVAKASEVGTKLAEAASISKELLTTVLADTTELMKEQVYEMKDRAVNVAIHGAERVGLYHPTVETESESKSVFNLSTGAGTAVESIEGLQGQAGARLAEAKQQRPHRQPNICQRITYTGFNLYNRAAEIATKLIEKGEEVMQKQPISTEPSIITKAQQKAAEEAELVKEKTSDVLATAAQRAAKLKSEAESAVKPKIETVTKTAAQLKSEAERKLEESKSAAIERIEQLKHKAEEIKSTTIPKVTGLVHKLKALSIGLGVTAKEQFNDWFNSTIRTVEESKRLLAEKEHQLKQKVEITSKCLSESIGSTGAGAGAGSGSGSGLGSGSTSTAAATTAGSQ